MMKNEFAYTEHNGRYYHDLAHTEESYVSFVGNIVEKKKGEKS